MRIFPNNKVLLSRRSSEAGVQIILVSVLEILVAQNFSHEGLVKIIHIISMSRNLSEYLSQLCLTIYFTNN